MGGCGKSGPEVVTDPAAVRRLARIPIPASATGLECRAERGLDTLAYGRFDVPAADLQALLAGVPDGARVGPLTGYSNVTAHPAAEPWWRPDLVREPRVAEWSAPGFSGNLLFGASDRPGIVTVYFFNFTT
jgi:hypothetical protein